MLLQFCFDVKISIFQHSPYFHPAHFFCTVNIHFNFTKLYINCNWNKALSASTGHYGAAEPMQCIFSLFRSSEEKIPSTENRTFFARGLTFRRRNRAESLPEMARAAPLRSTNAAVPSREHFFTRKVANFTEKNANFHSIHDRKRRALSEKPGKRRQQ